MWSLWWRSVPRSSDASVISRQEVDLIHATSITARILCFALLATILAAGMCGDAVAKAGKGRSYARNPASEEVSAQQQARLAPMRYYGGPKSPMWRGPAEN
jgi:hypothetical protein